MEIDFTPLNKREAKASNGIQTFKFKADYSEKAYYYLPARLDSEAIERIQKSVETAFAALTLRDTARFDLRISSEGIAYIIEVNAVAGLEPDRSDLPRMYKLLNKSYEELINDILGFALERIQRNERISF
jgi:D-alanine-D-alanine ligase